MELTSEQKHLIRIYAQDKSHPIDVVKGNRAPRMVGESGYYTTPNDVLHVLKHRGFFSLTASIFRNLPKDLAG